MKLMPLFPLSILPLPGELVPLHIFEPRYKQLLLDAEVNDISFGIFFNHEINHEKIGSLMKLESIIKRYPTGESDIVVKCCDNFTLETLYRNYKSKMYPGGDAQLWEVDSNQLVSEKLFLLFNEYLKRKSSNREASSNKYTIAQELNLELNDRYEFLTLDLSKQEDFLIRQVRYQIQILKYEEKSRDVYHLN